MNKNILSLNYYDKMGGNGPRASLDYLELCALQYGDDGAQDGERKRMIAVVKNIVHFELTDRQRDCICLRYVQGLPVHEVAAALEITPPTASRHLKKARKRIEKIMQMSFPRLQKGGGLHEQ